MLFSWTEYPFKYSPKYGKIPGLLACQRSKEDPKYYHLLIYIKLELYKRAENHVAHILPL